MNTNRTFYIFAAVIALAALITYSNHFHNEFHFDDDHTIVNNVYIRDISNIPSFFLDSTRSTSLPANQAYRPIVTATTAIDYWLGKGLNPFYFHLTTFVLFMIQGALMYFLYLKVFNLAFKHDRNRFVALFAVAWYLLHPANAETLNYVLARSDSISTLFVVLAFVCFLYSPVCRKWHLYLIPVAFGGLTKPTAVMFGPMLVAYVLLFEGQIGVGVILRKGRLERTVAVLKTTAIALLFCSMLYVFLRFMDSTTWVPGSTSRFHYLITQPFVLLHYFITFFLPISLSADTDWTTLATILDIRFFIGTVFVALLFLSALAASRKEKHLPIAFGILWFFIALIPTSTVIPLSEVMNDHRLFFPYVGLTMSVCWALYLFLDKIKSSFSSERTFFRTVVAVVVIALAIYAQGTWERNKVWRNDETLWLDVTRKSPQNGRGLMNYGLTLMVRADYAGAERYFTDAMRLIPNYSYLNTNMGIVTNAMGRPGEAERYFRNGIAVDPANPTGYHFYGVFLRGQNRPLEAMQQFIKVLELAPAHLHARHELMSMYFERRDTDKLRELAEQTLLIASNDREAAMYLAALQKGESVPGMAEGKIRGNRTPEDLLNLSLAYFNARQYLKSIEAAQEALTLRPGYDLAYNNICAAYNELGQWDQAIAAGEKAVKLNPNNRLAINNLEVARKGKTRAR